MDINENNVMNEIKTQSENKKSNKKIILITVISIVLIYIIVSILIITGVFKSKGEKFALLLTKDQYVVQMVENRAEDFLVDGETNINAALKKKFLSMIDSTFTLLGNDLILDANVIKQGENFDTKASLKLGAFELQSLELIKENNLTAISVPNLFSNFIAVNDENTEEIAKKLGFIEDSGDTKLNKDLKNIINKYSKVLVKSINEYIEVKDNIEISIKENNFTTKEYILSLGEKELNQIAINVLEKLKDDDETINLYATYANTETVNLKENINNLYNELLEGLANIQNEETILEIKLNVLDNKTIKTTININKTSEIILLANQDEKNDYALLSVKINDTILDLEYNGAKGEENYIGEVELKAEENTLTVLELTIEKVKDSTKTIRKISELNALLLNEASDEEIEKLRKEIEKNLGIVDEEEIEATIYEEGEFKVYNEDAIVKVLEPSKEAYNKIEIGMEKSKVIEIMDEPSASFEVEERENMGWYFDENNGIYFISVELTDGKISKVYNDIVSSMEDNVQVSVELGTKIEDVTSFVSKLEYGMTKNEVVNILGDKYLEISKDEEGYKTYKWYDKRENILVIEFDKEEKVSFVNEVTIDM